jgi:hypothetical protein
MDGSWNAIMMAKKREEGGWELWVGLPLSSLANEGEGGAGDILSPQNILGGDPAGPSH